MPKTALHLSKANRNPGTFLLLPSLAVMACFVLATGCATKKTVSSAPPRIWPAPPNPARVTYVQSIHQPADVGVKAIGFKRFIRRLTGSDKGNEALIKPFGVALDENDNLCLTDTGANVVCYFDRTKKKWHRWDKIGDWRFQVPVAVAKRNGVIFVADSGLASVLAFDENKKPRFKISEKLERPSGLAIVNDRLFVADSQRHCIVCFDLEGRFISEFGRRGTLDGEFNYPTHISADTEGNLLVTDSMNSRVQVFTKEGQFKNNIGSIGNTTGHFSRPKGVATDSFGHVYVIDALFDNIQIFDSTGTFLLNLGEAGQGSGEFWLPSGIAISRDNEIFVADSYNHRVQLFKYIGQP